MTDQSGELTDAELADTFARTLSGNVAEWPQLRPLLGRCATGLHELTKLREQVAHQTAAISAMAETCGRYGNQLAEALAMLRMASELAEDLRLYTHDWDWKYGKSWDADKKAIEDFLAARDAEATQGD